MIYFIMYINILLYVLVICNLMYAMNINRVVFKLYMLLWYCDPYCGMSRLCKIR